MECDIRMYGGQTTNFRPITYSYSHGNQFSNFKWEHKKKTFYECNTAQQMSWDNVARAIGQERIGDIKKLIGKLSTVSSLNVTGST